MKKQIDLNDYDHSKWDGIIWVYPAKRVESHQDTTVRCGKAPRQSWARMIQEAK